MGCSTDTLFFFTSSIKFDNPLTFYVVCLPKSVQVYLCACGGHREIWVSSCLSFSSDGTTGTSHHISFLVLGMQQAIPQLDALEQRVALLTVLWLLGLDPCQHRLRLAGCVRNISQMISDNP